jgi:membrane-bound lytic murein transglycosylase B
MSKTKVIILLLFLLISLVFALEWKLIIEAVDKAYRVVGLKTPSYILTIIEKESGFGENLGNNLGSKEENLKRCINMCYWTEEKNNLDGRKLVYCFDKEKQEYTIEARTQWCNNQYSALEKITSNLGLDINKVPFSPDFGIGYTQFQPTTWLQYKELKNKNPWNLEDSLICRGS